MAPFVAKDDRPDVRLNPDKPIAELKVRDLQTILSKALKKPVLADKPAKEPLKEHKDKEILAEKPDKEPLKEHKEKEPLLDKPDKEPLKEHKFEKLELEPAKHLPESLGTAASQPMLQSGIDEITRILGGLTKRIDELEDQVAELQKGTGKDRY